MATPKNKMTEQDFDALLDNIGIRVVNKALGRPIGDTKVDDFLAGRLARATEDQCLGVVDALCTGLATANIARSVLAGGVTKEELLDLTEVLNVLEDDVVGALQDLVQ
jgi:hypothetical protein